MVYHEEGRERDLLRRTGDWGGRECLCLSKAAQFLRSVLRRVSKDIPNRDYFHENTSTLSLRPPEDSCSSEPRSLPLPAGGGGHARGCRETAGVSPGNQWGGTAWLCRNNRQAGQPHPKSSRTDHTYQKKKKKILKVSQISYEVLIRPKTTMYFFLFP